MSHTPTTETRNATGSVFIEQYKHADGSASTVTMTQWRERKAECGVWLIDGDERSWTTPCAECQRIDIG